MGTPFSSPDLQYPITMHSVHISFLQHLSLLQDIVHDLQIMLLLVNMQKMLNQPKKLNVISTKEILLQFFSPSLTFGPFIFLKTNWSIHISKNKLGNTQAGFSLIIYHVMNVPKGTYHT
jgi:hypothetical protein